LSTNDLSHSTSIHHLVLSDLRARIAIAQLTAILLGLKLWNRFNTDVWRLWLVRSLYKLYSILRECLTLLEFARLFVLGAGFLLITSGAFFFLPPKVAVSCYLNCFIVAALLMGWGVGGLVFSILWNKYTYPRSIPFNHMYYLINLY